MLAVLISFQVTGENQKTTCDGVSLFRLGVRAIPVFLSVGKGEVHIMALAAEWCDAKSRRPTGVKAVENFQQPRQR